jgi:hypothetical protein
LFSIRNISFRRSYLFMVFTYLQIRKVFLLLFSLNFPSWHIQVMSIFCARCCQCQFCLYKARTSIECAVNLSLGWLRCQFTLLNEIHCLLAMNYTSVWMNSSEVYLKWIDSLWGYKIKLIPQDFLRSPVMRYNSDVSSGLPTCISAKQRYSPI